MFLSILYKLLFITAYMSFMMTIFHYHLCARSVREQKRVFTVFQCSVLLHNTTISVYFTFSNPIHRLSLARLYKLNICDVAINLKMNDVSMTCQTDDTLDPDACVWCVLSMSNSIPNRTLCNSSTAVGQ